MSEGKKEYSREELSREIVRLLQEMTSDWDLELEEDISAATNVIGDLEFESIDVVQFVVLLEETFKRKDLPFERLLMEEGRYRSDINVGEVVDFLHTHL